MSGDRTAPQAAVPMRTPLLIMLTLIYSLNYIDRQIVVILQEPIKHEYGLKDWQLGLLSGASLSLLYTAMSLPVANWVDRGANRVRMIAVFTAVWSLMTAVCGLTQTYLQFVIARMGVGLAEAGFPPAAHSLLSDLYPRRIRPMAMGVFSTGIQLGIMMGLVLGGTIAQAYSWRIALMVVGLPGIVIAIVFRLIAKEPIRGASEEANVQRDFAPVPFKEAVRELMHIPAYVHNLLGGMATTFAMTGVTSWVPSLLIREHGLSLSQVGLGLGLLTGASGLTAALFGGWQAARLGRRGLAATMWVPLIGLIIAMPLYIVAIVYGSASSILWMLFPALTLATLWSAPAVALRQTLSPLPLRATASALSIVAANVVGISLGPVATGILSDVYGHFTGDSAKGLHYALITMSLLLVWGIVHWILTIRALRKFDANAAAVAAAAV